MPGWWFTIEAVTSKHLMSQFNAAISAALASDDKTRALMRAYSVLQRFPVAQWVEDLEKLQYSSIHTSIKTRSRPNRLGALRSIGSRVSVFNRFSASTISGESGRSIPSAPSTVVSGGGSLTHQGLSLASPSPASLSPASLSPASLSPVASIFQFSDSMNLDGAVNGPSRQLSLRSVATTHSECSLQQNPAPIFTDSKNKYYNTFSQKLDKLNTKPSASNICIEEYIVESEKDWFNRYHSASLSTTSLLRGKKTEDSRRKSVAEYHEFLGDGYQAPRGVKMFMQMKIGTWYTYSFLLAFVRASPLS
jgi:alpha-1,3-glucan synthase